MNKAKWRRFVRKSHRYLAVIFGIQFLFWTLGGFYFSWTSIKRVRGEDLRKETPALNLPDRVLELSPFTHLAKVPAESLSASSVVVLSALAALLVGAGLGGVSRRDIG